VGISSIRNGLEYKLATPLMSPRPGRAGRGWRGRSWAYFGLSFPAAANRRRPSMPTPLLVQTRDLDQCTGRSSQRLSGGLQCNAAVASA
jgi:hypothetical protein